MNSILFKEAIVILLLFSLVISKSAFGNECDPLDLSMWVESESPSTTPAEHALIHISLRDLMRLPASMKNLEFSTAGSMPRGVSRDYQAMTWLRDRSPIWGYNNEGASQKPVLLTYTNPFSESVYPNPGLITYAPVAPPAGMPANSKPVSLAGKTQFVEIRNFPGILEGGNIQWTPHKSRSFLFTSEKTIDQNRYIASETMDRFQNQVNERFNGSGINPHSWTRSFLNYLRESGVKLPSREVSREEIIQNLATTVGLPRERVIVTEWMPGERTGHVDIWLGIIKGNLLAVPYIPENLISSLGYAHERSFSTSINAWLNQQVTRISQLEGVRIIRLPMLPPKNLTPSQLSSLGFDAQFLSPVNFVVQRDTIYVPEHQGWMARLSQTEQTQIRNEIVSKLASIGMKVEFVGSDRLMDHGGGLHCAVVDYPSFNP